MDTPRFPSRRALHPARRHLPAWPAFPCTNLPNLLAAPAGWGQRDADQHAWQCVSLELQPGWRRPAHRRRRHAAGACGCSWHTGPSVDGLRCPPGLLLAAPRHPPPLPPPFVQDAAAWPALQSIQLCWAVEFLLASHVCSYTCFTSQFAADADAAARHSNCWLSPKPGGAEGSACMGWPSAYPGVSGAGWFQVYSRFPTCGGCLSLVLPCTCVSGSCRWRGQQQRQVRSNPGGYALTPSWTSFVTALKLCRNQ